jgi:LytR cell envelope-related transcriptional attenuator
VDHAQEIPTPFPWRAVAVLAAGVALVELVALIAIGLVHLAPRATAEPAAATAKRAVHVAGRVNARVVHTVKVPSVPLRPRSHVRVLVLNGNGVSGAASSEAARLEAQGYRIGGATNAVRHDYARSMVMFVPGWIKEARRLAHDAGIRMVAPVDGLHPSQLRGSGVVLLLGK